MKKGGNKLWKCINYKCPMNEPPMTDGCAKFDMVDVESCSLGPKLYWVELDSDELTLNHKEKIKDINKMSIYEIMEHVHKRLSLPEKT